MKRIAILGYVVCFTAGSFLATAMTGCGGGDSKENTAAQGSPKASSTKPDSQVESSQVAAKETTGAASQESKDNSQQVAAKPELKGVWYGESVFDVDEVNKQIDQMEPQQAAKLQQMLDTFSSIVMAAEFRDDAGMELDMMIMTPDGQQMRDRSVGTWAVVEQTPTGLKISTKEYKNEAQEATEKVYVYQFIDKDHFQFVPDSVSPDLRAFSPRIVFQRVEEPLDDPAVAEENKNGDTVVR